MATKTIRLELDAYEKLVHARRDPGESLSSVVRRAQWPGVPVDAGQLLERLSALAIRHPEILLAPAVLDDMEQHRRAVRRKSAWER